MDARRGLRNFTILRPKASIYLILTLKLSDYYAVELQYERGRTPVFFEDVDKVTLKLTYMR